MQQSCFHLAHEVGRTAAPPAAPAASALRGWSNRGSGTHIASTKEQEDERAEYEAEKLADGQELQAIEPVGDTPTPARWAHRSCPVDWIAYSTVIRACCMVARRRHPTVSCAGNTVLLLKDSADWLREAHRRELRCRAGVGKVAVPRRRAAQTGGRQAVDRWAASVPNMQIINKDTEESVIGAAARGDRDDGKPLARPSAAACARRSARYRPGASASMKKPGRTPV